MAFLRSQVDGIIAHVKHHLREVFPCANSRGGLICHEDQEVGGVRTYQSYHRPRGRVKGAVATRPTGPLRASRPLRLHSPEIPQRLRSPIPPAPL